MSLARQLVARRCFYSAPVWGVTLSLRDRVREVWYMDQTQILLAKRKKKKRLLGGGLNRPLWLYFKTSSDALLPAANVNKWASEGNWGGREGQEVFVCTHTHTRAHSWPDRFSTFQCGWVSLVYLCEERHIRKILGREDVFWWKKKLFSDKVQYLHSGLENINYENFQIGCGVCGSKCHRHFNESQISVLFCSEPMP